ncbi:hypothetical protein BYI23_E001690 (plasmid) [Burkholderia sp. YI23]|nr:hypothetical protein BYI23_E001690 [Burkholderia sp. YI23]
MNQSLVSVCTELARSCRKRPRCRPNRSPKCCERLEGPLAGANFRVRVAAFSTGRPDQIGADLEEPGKDILQNDGAVDRVATVERVTRSDVSLDVVG